MTLFLLLLPVPWSAAQSDSQRFCKFQEIQWNLDQRSPGGRRTAQGGRARLYRHIKDLAVEYFEQDKENPIAQRASAFLKTSTVTLRLDDLEWMDKGTLHTLARYDGADNSITLDTDRPVLAAPNDAFLAVQLDKLRPSLPGLAPTLVHEARHARDHAALGALPGTNEKELLAYTEETMYVWRRLLADPHYLGLDQLDAKLRTLLGWPAHVPWWTDAVDYENLSKALGRLQRLKSGEIGDTSRVQDWILLHSLAGGYEVFEGNLHQFGLLSGEAIFSYPTHTLNYEVAVRRNLELIQKCARATKIAGLSRELDINWNVLNQNRIRWETTIGYNQPAKNYYIQEIVKQKREVDALVARP